MKHLVSCGLLLAALATTAAAGGNPRARVDAIDRAVRAGIQRTNHLPDSAAATEQLAADLTKLAADAGAALTPDLHVVSSYHGVADRIAELPALAAAVRASWPCHEAIRQEDLTRAMPACRAYAKAARGTHLEDDLYGIQSSLQALASKAQAKAERDREEAARAEAKAKADAELATTVMGHLQDMTADDSYDPAKIADAFRRVPADLIVSEPKPWSVRLEPFAKTANSCRAGEGKKITTEWYQNGDASSVEVFAAEEDPAAGVPLLIWQRTNRGAVLVSIDGLRYTTEHVDELVHGVPPREGWPKTPHQVCINDGMIEDLGPSGVLDAALVAKAAKARAAVGACVTRAWKAGDRELDANDTANITESTRANRRSAILERYGKRVEAACSGPRKAYQSAMLAVIAAHAKAREKALAAATAALAATPAAEP